MALSAAIASRHVPLAKDIEALATAHLSAADINAARAAAALMGMNNIYYRFLHLVEDEEYKQLPARLRMNVMANPGIDKQDFELLSLAVSAINGCGTCVASHERQLRQHGLSREGGAEHRAHRRGYSCRGRGCWSPRRTKPGVHKPTRPKRRKFVAQGHSELPPQMAPYSVRASGGKRGSRCFWGPVTIRDWFNGVGHLLDEHYIVVTLQICAKSALNGILARAVPTR